MIWGYHHFRKPPYSPIWPLDVTWKGSFWKQLPNLRRWYRPSSGECLVCLTIWCLAETTKTEAGLLPKSRGIHKSPARLHLFFFLWGWGLLENDRLMLMCDTFFIHLDFVLDDLLCIKVTIFFDLYYTKYIHFTRCLTMRCFSYSIHWKISHSFSLSDTPALGLRASRMESWVPSPVFEAWDPQQGFVWPWEVAPVLLPHIGRCSPWAERFV